MKKIRQIVRIIIKFLCLVALSFIAFFSHSNANNMDLDPIEKALGIQSESSSADCNSSYCSEDIDSLIDTLIQEKSADKPQTKSTIDYTEASIETNQSSDLISLEQAELIVLNKITAKSVREKFNLNEAKFFGHLSIEVHQCIKNTNLLNKNDFILLTVSDKKTENDNLPVFQGWMVSSNPSVSTLEHPVYEIIAVKCITNK